MLEEALAMAVKNENYEHALIALCVTAFCVLLAFIAVIVSDGDKILDLSNPNLRNPRKSKPSGKVTYVDRLTADLARSGTRKGKKRGKSGSRSYQGGMDDFVEGVGNLRVYKRGEEIEYNNDDDEF
jgi:hypothetical protein